MLLLYWLITSLGSQCNAVKTRWFNSKEPDVVLRDANLERRHGLRIWPNDDKVLKGILIAFKAFIFEEALFSGLKHNSHLGRSWAEEY